MAEQTKFEQSMLSLHRIYTAEVATFKQRIADREEAIKRLVGDNLNGAFTITLLRSHITDIAADKAKLEVMEQVSNQLQYRLERSGLLVSEQPVPSSAVVK